MVKIFVFKYSLSLFLGGLIVFMAGCGDTGTNSKPTSNSNVSGQAPAAEPTAVEPAVNTAAPAQTVANSHVNAKPSSDPSATNQTPKASLRAKDAKAVAGQPVTIEIELESREDIGVMIFSLDFDPSIFTYVSSALSSGAPKEAVLTVNDRVTQTGKLGVLVDSTVALPKGKRTVMSVVFLVAAAAGAGNHEIAFSSTPAAQSVADSKSALIATKFIPGTVRVAASR